MIVTHSSAQPELDKNQNYLWKCFQKIANEYFNSIEYNQWYTGNSYSEDTRKTFQQWVGNTKNEHKCIQHIACIKHYLPRRPAFLPIIIYEFASHLCSDGVKRPAIYLTALAEFGQHSEISQSIYKTLHQLPKLYANISHHHTDSCEDRTPKNGFRLPATINEAWLLTAVMTFDLIPSKQIAPIHSPTITDKIVTAIAKFFRIFSN